MMALIHGVPTSWRRVVNGRVLEYGLDFGQPAYHKKAQHDELVWETQT